MIIVFKQNATVAEKSKVKEQLEKSGCRILGTVLNRTSTGNSGGYYKKYYGKYYKKYDKYYEDRSERESDAVKKASSELETAIMAEPKITEENNISVISVKREKENMADTDISGRKAGCSRKRKERD